MAQHGQLDDDPLAALRERIRSTAAAADRLADQAARAGNGAPGSDAPPPRTDEAAQEAQALVALVGLLRDLVPDELRQQVLDLVRQILRLIRAIIDWYLQRLEAGPRAGQPASREPVVEDIPLD
jgi:hypothetical protein